MEIQTRRLRYTECHAKAIADSSISAVEESDWYDYIPYEALGGKYIHR